MPWSGFEGAESPSWELEGKALERKEVTNLPAPNMRLRFAIIFALLVVGFVLMAVKLTDLQLRQYEVYGAKAESSRTKTLTIKGSRGQIQDANGVVLAYDKKIYNVQFYAEPKASGDSRTTEQRNTAYTRAIWDSIQIIEHAGKQTISTFWLRQLEDGTWVFDVGNNIHLSPEGIWEFNTPPEDPKAVPSESSISVAETRVRMWRENFSYTTKNSDGTYYTSTQDIFARLCASYGLDALDAELPERSKLTLEDKLKIMAVWQEMRMNAFASKPITMAADVPWSTVIELEMRSILLEGISISIGNQRVYPQGTTACHVIGYVGSIPESWWNNTKTADGKNAYLDKGYGISDKIGLDGIEKTMEDYLTGSSKDRTGSKTIEVNYAGRVMRELAQIDPADGNTVRLTLRADLQRVAEKALAETVNEIRDKQEKTIRDSKWLETNQAKLLARNFETQPLRLAQNGAIVVLDMQARVLAMASFPDYDPNLFVIGMDESQRERMLADPRHPLFNNAIGSRDTPGSIFKMVTALAALTSGTITPQTIINDQSPFDDHIDKTVNPNQHGPSCWANPTIRSTIHQNQTVVQGLRNSCNYFFFTAAYRMGSDGESLYNYASKLGLTTKTNIDLPGELKGIVGHQDTLYDPNRPITEADQDTAVPMLVRAQIKAHLRRIGEKYNTTYNEDRLDKAVKALMDEAIVKPQSEWISSFRIILMRELGMRRDIVILTDTMSDIYRILNDIKWGANLTIMTAIGQSITMVTPVAVARYLVAVANGGLVYDVSIVDSIISPTGEVLNPLNKPVVVNDLTDEISPYIDYIWEGMADVVDEGGTAGTYFSRDWLAKYPIAGKTGTAQKSVLDVENNAWFIAYAPLEKPEIAVVVYVPNGMSAGWASPAAKAVVQAYMDSRVTPELPIIPGPDELAR
ncbi:penicillin-binding protein [Clostridia bacterium]|nr:penicillin-binding protein [Clostridia bacterium]